MVFTQGLMILGLVFVFAMIPNVPQAQIQDWPDDEREGIPINYTEANVGEYSLPDPLKLKDGQSVTDAKIWFEKRRPEILKLFEEHQYGRTPGPPKDLSFDVFDHGTSAFDGKAMRKQVTVYFSKDRTDPQMDLLIYLPVNADKPVPLLLNISFAANASLVDDPGVKKAPFGTAKNKTCLLQTTRVLAIWASCPSWRMDLALPLSTMATSTRTSWAASRTASGICTSNPVRPNPYPTNGAPYRPGPGA